MDITRAFLQTNYVRKGLSTWAIEKQFGISRSRVYAALKKYGIAARTIARSHIRYRRVVFSDNPLEEAYLVGFAIGDLRIRNHNGERSETISIGCGSTQPAQIQLFKKLFSRYGRVWQGKPDKRGAINIEAWVDKTFSFLLPAQRNYQRFSKNKKLFFAFLAGFTDAEGSFFISNNQARVAWGNYNTAVLRFIKNNLTRFGIETPKMYHDNLRGMVGVHGYSRNKNYYHVTCTQKAMVGKLFKNLKPHVLHADKKRDMARLQKNLILRGVRL